MDDTVREAEILLVEDTPTDAELAERGLRKAGIALARAFDLQTVAESIEIVEHYRALLDMSREIEQGYYFARPMPADELTIWRAG
jgi:EAL domain-containing protein (putative c-di-GMP-specific phosphodiesterase class I)